MFIRELLSRKKENDDTLTMPNGEYRPLVNENASSLDGDEAKEVKVAVFDNADHEETPGPYDEEFKNDFTYLCALEQKMIFQGESSAEIVRRLRADIRPENCCHYTVSNYGVILGAGGVILILIGMIGIVASSIGHENDPPDSAYDYLLVMGAGAIIGICGGLCTVIQGEVSQNLLEILPPEPIQASRLFDEEDSHRLSKITALHMNVPVPQRIDTSRDLRNVISIIRSLKKEMPLFRDKLSHALNEVGFFNTIDSDTRQGLQKLIVDYVVAPVPNESKSENKKLLAR